MQVRDSQTERGFTEVVGDCPEKDNLFDIIEKIGRLNLIVMRQCGILISELWIRGIS